jgi:hypothetical protein
MLLLWFVKRLHRQACKQIMRDHREMFCQAPGSGHNHQAFKGGYLGHVSEVMTIGFVLWWTSRVFWYRRSLSFTLSDVLLILFLHDIEKPFKYTPTEDGGVEIGSKDERERFRYELLERYGIVLDSEQDNAMRYVEGEYRDYSSTKRVMRELAAFCHVCDVISARIYWNEPRLLA